MDITGATGDITRTVNCEAPPGVTFSGASAVVVTVHMVSQAGATPAPKSGAIQPPPRAA